MMQGQKAAGMLEGAADFGDPRDSVSGSPESPAYRTWAGRHPWVAFVLGAPLLFVGSLVLCTLLVICGAAALAGKTVQTNPTLVQAFAWVGLSIAYVSPGMAAFALCWLVHRSGRRRFWALASCALLALLAGCLMVSCQVPQTTPGTGKLVIGFGVGGVWHVSQALVPLLVGCTFLFVCRRDSGPTACAVLSEQPRLAA